MQDISSSIEDAPLKAAVAAGMVSWVQAGAAQLPPVQDSTQVAGGAGTSKDVAEGTIAAQDEGITMVDSPEALLQDFD